MTSFSSNRATSARGLRAAAPSWSTAECATWNRATCRWSWRPSKSRPTLLDQSDFGRGTSSRSTKLVHGGVRYLEQGNVSLVMEALKERGLLLQNAPHLVHDLQFVVPNYSWWETPFYGIGLKIYDVLAGKYGFGKSRILSREETLKDLPTLKQDG